MSPTAADATFVLFSGLRKELKLEQFKPSDQSHRLFYGPDVYVGNSTAKLLRAQSSRLTR
jgi:hypothetical protein